MTMNSCPSSAVSMSWIVQMFGWLVAEAACASRTKRCFAVVVVTPLRREELQGNGAAKLRVAGLVDHAHATATDAGDDDVGTNRLADQGINVGRGHGFQPIINRGSTFGGGRRRLSTEDDLADMLARLHETVRGGGLGQWKDAMDDRFDGATIEQRPDLGSQRGCDLPLLLDASRPERRAGDRQSAGRGCGGDRRTPWAHRS